MVAQDHWQTQVVRGVNILMHAVGSQHAKSQNYMNVKKKVIVFFLEIAFLPILSEWSSVFFKFGLWRHVDVN